MASPTGSSGTNEAQPHLHASDTDATQLRVNLHSFSAHTSNDDGLSLSLQLVVSSARKPLTSAPVTNTVSLPADCEDLFTVDALQDRPCYLPDEVRASTANKSQFLATSAGWQLHGWSEEAGGGDLQLNGAAQADDQPLTDAVLEKNDQHQATNLCGQTSTSDHGKPNPDPAADSSSSHGGTSGYMAESGSRSASVSSDNSGPGDVIDGPIGQTSKSTQSWSDWVPGKRHHDEVSFRVNA